MICANPKCGKEFIKTTYNRIFCSKDCQQNSYWVKTIRPFRICLYCAKEYQCKSNNDKYCSDSCATKFRYSLKRKVHIKKCLNCKKSFVTTYKLTKYCSKKCYRKTPESKKYQSDLNKTTKYKILRKAIHLKRVKSGVLRKWKKKQRNKLADPYIKDKLRRSGFELVPKQLIELKRIHLKLYRTIKQKQL